MRRKGIMFKEILKIIPQVDNKDLSKMERSLGRRFKKIAKKFGSGLKTALLGGGIAGLAVGLINKILNPLKEVQESIDRILTQGDDLKTYAKQFNTTPGELAKLQAFGESTGVSREFLFQLISRFQTRVAESKQDPNLKSSVREFVGRDDTAQAFFDFVQNLKKLDPGDQAIVQKQIFGEEAAVRTADFLQADFNALNKQFSQITADEINKAVNRTAGLSDLKDSLKAQRNLEDLISKSRLINEKVIRSEDERERINLQRESERIKAYNSISTISETSARILTLVEKAVLSLTEMITKLSNLENFTKQIKPSRIFRGLFGGDDD